MATVTKTGNFIEVTLLTADLTPAQIFQDSGAFDQEGRKIKSILFVAGNDDDKLVVKNRTASGSLIVLLATPDKELPAIRYFDKGGQFMAPFIDFSEGTFSKGYRIVFEMA